MTSDAKVGLLLGLVFIIIIAFVINGLPDFLQPDNEKAFVTGISVQPDLGDLSNKADLAIKSVEKMELPSRSVPTEISDDKVRFTHQIPNQNRPLRKKFSPLPEPVANSTRTYIVKSGDNLAVIAKKVYGDEDGNRRAIIQKLYQFNKKTMPRPDSLQVGQKLIIPPIVSLQDGPVPEAISVSGVLKTVKDIAGRKYTEMKNTIGIEKPSSAE